MLVLLGGDGQPMVEGGLGALQVLDKRPKGGSHPVPDQSPLPKVSRLLWGRRRLAEVVNPPPLCLVPLFPS